MKVLKGVGVSQGIAMGQVLKVERGLSPVARIRLQDDAAVEKDLLRFDHAVQTTITELHQFQDKMEQSLGHDHSLIIQAHIMILRDAHFAGAIREIIRRDRVNAEWAVTLVRERIQDAYESLQDPYLRDKIHDIRDIANRLLGNLTGLQPNGNHYTQDNVIIVSPEVTLSHLSLLDLNALKGFAMDFGGWTSHTSIIARALKIPAVIHLNRITPQVRTGDILLLDGFSGHVYINPDGETIDRYQHLEESTPPVTGPFCLLENRARRAERALQDVRLYVNAELPVELEDFQATGAEGVGLFRSEFMFLGKLLNEITIEDHATAYRQVADLIYPGTLNIRTFDIDMEKVTPLATYHEPNPALGMRGIRLSIEYPDSFRRQLEGILRANQRGNLRITFPFVSSLDEVLAIKQILADIPAAGTDAQLPAPAIGVMLEIPSTFFITEILCQEVDFFTLGTNDLVQFTLAQDRGGYQHISPFSSAHPAVRMGLEMIRRASARHQKEVICCGEMSSHPFFVLILLAIGFRSISVNSNFLPLLHYILGQVTESSLAAFYERLSALHRLDTIESFFLNELTGFFPEPLVDVLLQAYHQDRR